MTNKIALLSLLLISTNASAVLRTYGVDPVINPSNKNVTDDTVGQLIQFMQPNLDDYTAGVISKSILRHSKDIGIDWRLFVSILFQESSLSLDPQNCYMNELYPPMERVRHKKHGHTTYTIERKKSHRCMDYGIAQINFHTWGKVLDLNKELLLTDIDYSIAAGAKILYYYKKNFSKHDPKWHLRYHSNTPEYKNAYGKVLHKRIKKINKFVKDNKKEGK